MNSQYKKKLNHNHIVAIDGLRALAALLVFIQHILQQFSPGSYSNSLGWAGVTIFFLLSGFVIHYPRAQAVVQKTKKLDIVEFWRRRLFRILPAYLVVLLISWWMGQLQKTNLLSSYYGVYDFFLHLVFLHNLRPETFYSINAVLWSIAIEMQFYLIYTLFYRSFKFTFRENLTLILLSLIWYFIVSLLISEPWRGVLQRSFVTTFWIWHLGATMATRFASRAGEVRKDNYSLVLVISVLILLWDPVVLKLHIIYWVGPLVLAIFIWKTLAFKTHKSLNYIGKISYSLYLIHPLAICLVIYWGWDYPQYWVIPLALGLAVLGYYGIEVPFIKLNKRKIVTL